ncbi:RNA polymerase sigma factor [Dyadobacter sp. CY323]|uniref:RNA polymerase sigma factor n=1 Tax=Dyadobacter sp. CY323 TaxID=2907302 RepID=UPI001F2CC4C4|nr:sigma-70 family RNA polymerase sigma factor [Dyadobacter sp. CY323]MCE6992938.1 sigma-70 family RNA polymerase sigma factor [Dyadobacter sp. CY323]
MDTELHREWVNGLRSGDQKAFTAIYKAYWYQMFQVVYRKTNEREVAEEIVQEIFTRLWKERSTLLITHLDRYLFTAVRYEVIDYLRSKTKTTALDDFFGELTEYRGTDTENTILYNDLKESIHRGLQELPMKSRDIFVKSRFEYWSVADISKHYQLSEKAVEYHLTKALKHMRFYLSEHIIIYLSALYLASVLL